MAWDDQPDEDRWFSVDPKGQREDEAPSHPGRRRGPSFLSVLLGVVVVAIAAVAWINRTEGERASPPPRSPSMTTTTSPTPTGERTAPSSSLPRPSINITRIGRNPLRSNTPWELYVLQPDSLSRIEMQSGLVTRSSFEAHEGPGSMSIVPFDGRVLITTDHMGPAYSVTDKGEVSVVPGLDSGVVVPIADRDRLWWAPADWGAASRLELRESDGRAVEGGGIDLSSDLWSGSARSDGAGGLLVDGADGAYRWTGEAFRRVTTGVVIAATASGWLVNECDEVHRCRLALVERDGDERRDLGEAILRAQGGSIDPAGRMAVVIDGDDTGNVLRSIDLRTGAREQLDGLTPVGGMSTIVWSPDSRWAIVADERLGVVAVDVSTGRLTSLRGLDGEVRALATRLGRS